ncbi:hypothetical protein QNA08_12195 [Chelatococcus sp. SYSU_G07232]|uniref:RDD domain-containing protein n=1 Tax=Chelatococcus albus TaxID=3047466 RepID=A0ABT7AK75_9HYPH|nr:hypothetical protein [Chelatococcus sp. SYSU_G07232]MDJ1158996.1 hypothetical protein [Chelatococcus sp. SYSU_G07232]
MRHVVVGQEDRAAAATLAGAGLDEGVAGAGEEYRRTGAEMHPAVYGAVVLAFAWLLGVCWLTFRNDAQSAMAVVISIVYILMYFGTPALMARLGRRGEDAPRRRGLAVFLDGRVDTGGGWLTGREALAQIVMIPAALALAATAICLVVLFTR